ncbi:MAG: hemin uptake protein HemP [Pseudomonadota bacterium]
MRAAGRDPHPNPLPQAGEGATPFPFPRAPEGVPLLPLPLAGEGGGEGLAVIAQITSAQLFQGAHEVQIDHHGVIYRLKQTALGKLILTK